MNVLRKKQRFKDSIMGFLVFWVLALVFPGAMMAEELTPICSETTGIYVQPESGYALFNDKCYFRGWGYGGNYVFEYNGVQPPQIAPNFPDGLNPSQFKVFSNRLCFFSEDENTWKYAIYSYDGNNAPVQVTTPVFSRDSDSPFILLNGKLYFYAAYNNGEYQSWVYDGINPPSVDPLLNTYAITQQIVYNNRLYLPSGTGNLYSYDGINAVRLDATLPSGYTFAENRPIQVLNSKLYFWTMDSSYTPALFSYNPGPRTFQFIYTMDRNLCPLTSFNNHLYTLATPYFPTHYSQMVLESCDGLNPPTQVNAFPSLLWMNNFISKSAAPANGKLFFGLDFGYYLYHTLQLWSVDSSNNLWLACQLPFEDPDTISYYIRDIFEWNGLVYLFTHHEFYRFDPSPSAITVVSPNGMEYWRAGKQYNISWTAESSITQVNIEISADDGETWSLLATSVPNTGSYTVEAPTSISELCRIKITNTNGSASDTSNGSFAIKSPLVIQITAPNGGEVLTMGWSGEITWEIENDIPGEEAIVEFSLDGGNTWNLEGMYPDSRVLLNRCSVHWIYPETPSQNCLVRVRELTSGTADTSDAVFTIAPETSLDLLTPQFHENIEAGSMYPITWSHTGDINTVKLRLSTDGQATWTTIVESTPNTGSFNWTVPNTTSTQCFIQIEDGYSSVYDIAGVFSIIAAKTITLNAPNGGESLEVGTTQAITWSYTGTIPNVKLEYSTDNGSSWNTITNSTANTGSYNWTVPNSPATTCLVKVSDAAGTANDSSNAVFSILAARTITVLTPNGGESPEAGTTQAITWSYTGTIPNVKLEYTADNGSSWNTITNSTANTGSYNWTVPNSPSTNCLIKVTDAAGTATDSSNTVFSILAARTITVLTPNGGESPEAGTTQAITWSYTGTIPNVKLEYTTNNGSSWNTITNSTANTGSFNWTVPNSPSTSCLIKVTDAAGTATDSSNAVFSILAARTITVLTPNGGESPEAGTTQAITWSYTGTIPNVKLEYTTNNGSSWNTITNSTANTGSFNWTVPNSPSTSCLIKVTDAAGTATDSSNAVFSILAARTITVTAPNGGQRWFIGSAYTITWTYTGTIANVQLQYSTNSGSTWNTIETSITNSGTYSWTVPNSPSTNCLVKINDVSGSAADVSNAVFTIDIVPTITVTVPNGGQSWTQGTTQSITWTNTGTIANVAISYSTNNGSTWNVIQSSTANTGSYAWVIPAVDSTTCLVKVNDTATSATDTSNSTFTLWRLPSLTVTAPNGGESWKRNTYKTITWTSTGNISTVKLQYTINGGTSWTTITTSTANSGSYSWWVPNVSQTKTTCKVKIIANGVTANDTSNANFTILK